MVWDMGYVVCDKGLLSSGFGEWYVIWVHRVRRVH